MFVEGDMTQNLSRVRNVLLRSVVALSLAFLAWLYARSRHQETVDDVMIPVHVCLAPADMDHHDLEINGASRIQVSFSGPLPRVRELRSQLQRGEVQVNVALTVPEEKQNDSMYRDTVRIEPEDVPVPPGVIASVVEGRNTVQVTVHRLVERHLPVRLETVGETRYSQVKIEPASVLVRGPQDVLDQARAIATEAYVVPPAPDTAASNEMLLRGEVGLVKEIDGRPIQCNPATVSFRYRLHPRQRTYELTDIPVRFLCPPAFPWRPHFSQPAEGMVTVRVVGPASDELPQVQAFVDLTDGTFEQGRNREAVRLQLPKDFQPASDVPRLVTFVLDPQ
jgi:hypothetical protein